MGDEDFHTVLRAIRQRGRPSTGDDLRGMRIDLELGLAGLEQIDSQSIVVEQTENADRLLQASCRSMPEVSTDDAVEAIRQEWLAHLRYDHREAHRTTPSDEGAIFELVTQMDHDGIYITGQIEIRSGPASPPTTA